MKTLLMRLALGGMSVSAALAGDRLPRPQVPDREPPVVTLHVSEALRFLYVFEVEATDGGGIAEVLAAVDGKLIEARIHEPWQFYYGDRRTTIPTPFEVCVQAEDRAGNWSPRICEVVTGPDPCESNGDCSIGQYCYRPAYRCEGPGACRVRPGFCNSLPPPCCPVPDFLLVCGCNGETRWDACDLANEGVNVAHPGRCR